MSESSFLPLNNAQVREVDARAELQVRRYFDHYLKNVVPEQEKAAREHVAIKLKLHDDAEDAHGYVEQRLNKAIWLVCGAAMFGSGGAVGVLKLLGGLGG